MFISKKCKIFFSVIFAICSITYVDNTLERGFGYLKLEKEDKYWFSHRFKYLAWSVITTVVTFSAVIQIYYGTSFGVVRTYIWMGGAIASFVCTFLLFTPLQLAVFAVFDSLFLKLSTTVNNRKFDSSMLNNEANSEKLRQIIEMRKCNKHLYEPQEAHITKYRFQDIKFNLEMRNLTAEIFSSSAFIVLVFCAAMVMYGSHNLDSVINLVVEGRYTDSMPFSEVTTYDRFLQYLRQTLLPALILSDDERAPRLRNGPLRESTVFDLGRTMEPAIKLMGVPRLRQIRATSGSCRVSSVPEARSAKCHRQNFLNADTRNYSLGWTPAVQMMSYRKEDIPWMYQAGQRTGTAGVFTKHSYYPSGGYILDLADSIEDSLTLIDFMNKFDWVDSLTEAVFIEFTTFCANTNILVVVTLVIERTSTGYFLPSVQMEPCKLLILSENIKTMHALGICLFICFLVYFTVKETLRMRRTSAKLYFARGFLVLNLGLVLCGVLTMVLVIVRTQKLSLLLDQFAESNWNSSLGFHSVACWFKWSLYLGALLVFLASLKLLHLLSYGVFYRKFHSAFFHCSAHFLNFLIQEFVLMTGFALVFYLSLLLYDYPMNGLIAWLPVRTSAPASSLVFVAFFFCFLLVFGLMSSNIFLAIVCFFIHAISKDSFANKYQILKYVKYLLTRTERNDIFPFNNKMYSLEKSPLSKLQENVQTQSIELHHQTKITRVSEAHFVERRTSEAAALPFDLSQAKTSLMRALTVPFFTPDKTQRILARRTAIRAQFFSLTHPRVLKSAHRGTATPFHLVSGKKTEDLVPTRKLTQMRGLVETFLMKRSSSSVNIQDLSGFSRTINRINQVDKKLKFILMRKTNSGLD